MWPNLESEMDAFKQSCYSEWYRQFRARLPTTTDAEKRRKHEFLEIENSFLYLISFVVSTYRDGGWGHGTKYPHLLTSHMLRLLTDMKVSLKDRWNPASAPLPGPTASYGNLYLSSEMLINMFRSDPAETNDQFAMWGTDFWDDCYIVLSLFKVWDELFTINRLKTDAFDDNWQISHPWLREQVRDRFRKVSDLSSWFGPGFHAAAIELFDYLQQTQRIEDGQKLIRQVVRDVVPRIQKACGKSRFTPDIHFAWHAGQLIVAWHQKRERYEALRDIDGHMQKLYEKLKDLQDKDDGAWRFDNDATNTNYNTVRGLAACYVMEKNNGNGLLASEEIRRAHEYLLRQVRQAKPLEGVDKACVNAIEAFQNLFGFTIPNIHFHLLVSLSYRLHCLGLEKTILSPRPENESKLLKTVRSVAKKHLEKQGYQAIEPLGVNGRLYDYLNIKGEFLAEFNEGDHEKTRKQIQRFLSSTMTEVRSIHAKSLIKQLWTIEGLLNFLPLIDHLSDLESERAFYAFYRDHLNHEVLLFLLGAYIYYEHKTLRQNINDEIESTYKHFSASPPKNLEKEFLFRWKLIATFHDVGYLFEIDPDPGRYRTKKDWRNEKTRLLKESFGMIETVRREFLPEYFRQFNRTSGKTNLESDVAAIEKGLEKYLPQIRNAEDLFTLKTAGEQSDAFSIIDEMLNTRGGERIKPGLIKNYFNLCRSTASLHRGKFYDHGIMSALILLKVADIHNFYLRRLSVEKFSKKLGRYPTFRKLLMQESKTDTEALERFHIRFSHVAGAIALHNIYPGLYTQKQCSDFDRKGKRKEDKLLGRAFYPKNPRAKDRYAISPDENPMAYLTAMADVLQDWDRHSFRRVPYEQDDKTPISSSEVMINCEPDKIVVTPLSTSARRRYRNHLKGVKDYLLESNSYVQLSGLDKYLED